jgi:hypothetical protein
MVVWCFYNRNYDEREIEYGERFLQILGFGALCFWVLAASLCSCCEFSVVGFVLCVFVYLSVLEKLPKT